MDKVAANVAGTMTGRFRGGPCRGRLSLFASARSG